MMGGSEGKVVYLHHTTAQLKVNIILCVVCYGPNEVFTVCVFVVCCTQIHTFTMSLIQISLEILIVGKESGITVDGKVLLT